MERISAKRRFLGAAFAFAFLTGALPAGAQEINLQAPKEDQSLPREALTELQEKIDTTEALIESTREKERAVLQELEASDRRLEALRKKSDQATREAVKRGGRAKALEAEASAIRKSLALQQAALSNTLRRLYRQGSPSTAEVLLSSSTLTEAAERATYARRLARMDQQRIARYRETLEELAESRRRIKETSIRLTEDRAEADLKAKELLKQAEAKRALLASIQRERLRHEQTQAEMEEAARDLTALIARLDDKHKPEATYTVEPKRESRARDSFLGLSKDGS
jgi:septal ring factor EnvC (AmiA/AmiB activator)